MALTCLLDTSVWNRLDRAPALAAEVTAPRRGWVLFHRCLALRASTHHQHPRPPDASTLSEPSSEEMYYLLAPALTARGLAPATFTGAFNTFRRVLDLAVDAGVLPVTAVP